MQGAYLDILQPVAWVINQLIFVYFVLFTSHNIELPELLKVKIKIYGNHGDRGVFAFSPKTPK